MYSVKHVQSFLACKRRQKSTAPLEQDSTKAGRFSRLLDTTLIRSESEQLAHLPDDERKSAVLNCERALFCWYLR
jgi:hypothetical protein